MSGIVWLTYVCQLAILASLDHEGQHLRIVHQRLLDLAEPRPVLGGGEHADGVGRVPPDHGRQRRDILGAMLTGEVIRLLELLLHIIPLDARVWMDRY